MNKEFQSALKPVYSWFQSKGWRPHTFQEEIWQACLHNESGLLNAPTGSGKTYALWMAFVSKKFLNSGFKTSDGLQIIWITPLRALAADIKKALDRVVADLKISCTVAIRTGDTSSAEKQRMVKNLPNCLITTPETLHIMMSHRQSERYFKNLEMVVVDEWHELMGNKRGVQTELALAYFKKISRQNLLVWGISATIGNLDEATKVLLGSAHQGKYRLVKAKSTKKIQVKTIIPKQMERYPWAGHLGLSLLPDVLEIIQKSKSTLVFTNTRNQSEIWYREILNKAPELAGDMALHHGSLNRELRSWVEQALAAGRLKLVVCTSTLDLGVDFSPVETTIQIGGAKGVSRFIQRAGRSGHQPGATSKIYFVPTHALELLEGAALKDAVKQNAHEDRKPVVMPFDVLVQFLVTIASGPGFEEEATFDLLKSTHAFNELTETAWKWALSFVTTGGSSLKAYPEYSKVEIVDGKYIIHNKSTLMRHRLSIGTIVSDPIMRLKYLGGGTIGTIEESFIGLIKPGDVFWFAGRSLELVKVHDMTAWVRRSKSKKGIVPRWMGGRMPLSSQLAGLIRKKLTEATMGNFEGEEMLALKPLLQLQNELSTIPDENALLIEKIKSREGNHLFFYPFQGRFVHEILAAIVAYRISKIQAISFSIAMNDYGFELLSDAEIPIEEALEIDLFSMENLLEDMSLSINNTEMAKRRFRDIAAISGLVFTGFPGKPISGKHLQASAQIMFDVFKSYDPDNLLVRQAHEEVITMQIDMSRLLQTLENISQQKIELSHPTKLTPFCFPILVDRLREKLSSEKLSDRISKLLAGLDKQKSKPKKSKSQS